MAPDGRFDPWWGGYWIYVCVPQSNCASCYSLTPIDRRLFVNPVLSQWDVSTPPQSLVSHQYNSHYHGFIQDFLKGGGELVADISS